MDLTTFYYKIVFRENEIRTISYIKLGFIVLRAIPIKTIYTFILTLACIGKWFVNNFVYSSYNYRITYNSKSVAISLYLEKLSTLLILSLSIIVL